MMINLIHSIYFRIINKIYRLKKKKSWSAIPSSESTTFFSNEMQLFEPHLIGTETIAKKSSSVETYSGVIRVLQGLEKETSVAFVIDYITNGMNRFGNSWIYSDINTVLYSISSLINIENYMEIGVRRGRSMSIVASQRNEVKMFGFDMWIKDYVGTENPGKQFVLNELKKVGHSGPVKFIDGDSKITVPKFFVENPNLYFDLITVDGDHSLNGAKTDLRNVRDRLKIGGILVFDDISSHEHPYLQKLWNREIKNKKNFYTCEFTNLGLGVAFAIRKY